MYSEPKLNCHMKIQKVLRSIVKFLPILIPMAIVGIPFTLCCLFLLGLGKLTGLTYNQISVVVNLWAQGAVLALSALAPCVAWGVVCWGMWDVLHVLVFITLLTYGAVYVVAFVLMLKHYHLPFDDAFRLCMNELQAGADRLGISYMTINLLIFVVGYLAVLGANVILTYLIWMM